MLFGSADDFLISWDLLCTADCLTSEGKVDTRANSKEACFSFLFLFLKR